MFSGHVFTQPLLLTAPTKGNLFCLFWSCLPLPERQETTTVTSKTGGSGVVSVSLCFYRDLNYIVLCHFASSQCLMKWSLYNVVRTTRGHNDMSKIGISLMTTLNKKEKKTYVAKLDGLHIVAWQGALHRLVILKFPTLARDNLVTITPVTFVCGACVVKLKMANVRAEKSGFGRDVKAKVQWFWLNVFISIYPMGRKYML